MSKNRVLQRWINWNTHGEGKSSSSTGERYHYRDDVIFSGDRPVARIVPGSRNDYICLTRGTVYLNKLTSLYVPDIGVYSTYEGDGLSVSELHERIRWLFLQEASTEVDSAWKATPPQFVGGQRWFDVRSIAQRYNIYAHTFGLKWRPFPTAMYEGQIKAILEQHQTAYDSPKEVAKRERRWARKEAKKALGLDE